MAVFLGQLSTPPRAFSPPSSSSSPSPPGEWQHIPLSISLCFLSSYMVVSVVWPGKEHGSRSSSIGLRDDWRKRSKPIPPGGTYPAKDHCRFFLSCVLTLCFLYLLLYILMVDYGCSFFFPVNAW